MKKMEFIEALTNRRSVYSIDKKIKIQEKEIVEILEEAVLNTPSAYNSQSQTVVLLLNEHHDKLWDLVKQEIKKLVKPEDFVKSEQKINNFKAGYGTVLFFDDGEITEGLTKKFPLYKDNFLKWSIEQNGMLQGNVWVGLETLGLGASLQHYNELIEKQVMSWLDLPEKWNLTAQMPFGNLLEHPDPKPKKSIDLRLKIFK
jgi:predicted oxidoreductase (fatty acid repression mutant protein)